MKKLAAIIALLILNFSLLYAQEYTAATENLEAPHQFQDNKYYSILDWYRNDYPYETGRTGKGTGRTVKSNYTLYLQFMKNQLTELLTNYGEIRSIWFDGHWDQPTRESHADRAPRIDRK